MRRVLLTLLAVLVVGIWTPDTSRASCATSSDADLLSAADVIFSGTVVSDQAAKLGAEREYTVRVDKVYRGAAFEEQIVATEARTSTALDLDVQQAYLIYAAYPTAGTIGPVSRLVSNSCHGSRPLLTGEALPAGLGSGQPPSAGSSRSFTSQLNGQLWIVVGVGCIIFAIILTLRRRSTR